MNDLEQMVQLAQGGDDAAFDELVRRTLPGMYRFLRSLGANEEDAADAAQEAYVRVWRALDSFDAARPFAPWLYQIARRTLYDLYRKQTRSSMAWTDEAAADVIDPEPLPDALFERTEAQEQVRAAILELGPNERTVLMLRYDEGLSFEEIAESLSMPAGSVRSIHHRALAKLREQLKHLL